MKCNVYENLQEIKIKPIIVQVWKHLPKEQTWGQSKQCAVMNVFAH